VPSIVLMLEIIEPIAAVIITLGEEHRLRIFENRVLRRVFGPKREEDGS
jgi:hypothetical protein